LYTTSGTISGTPVGTFAWFTVLITVQDKPGAIRLFDALGRRVHDLV
jgi:hypothetical protein